MEKQVVYLEDAHIYQQDILILRDINLSIKESEFVYLIGKTGTGKSTLLRTLYGDLKLTKGKGEVSGFKLESLKNRDIPYLRRKLGIIFQDFQLLTDRSVADNLNFVLKATGWKNEDLIKKRIEEVLFQVDLSTKDFKMPYTLSGGEQQRVAFARALLNDPKVILADEPTGNLDPDTSMEILELLHNIRKSGTAVLMATHNYKIIERFPSRILRLEKGEITQLN